MTDEKDVYRLARAELLSQELGAMVKAHPRLAEPIVRVVIRHVVSRFQAGLGDEVELVEVGVGEEDAGRWH